AAAVGGIISLSIGIVLMAGFPPREQFVSQLWFNELIPTVAIVMLLISVFFGFLIYKAVQAVRSKPYLREIPDEYGRAVDLLTPGIEGYVRIGGELWKAISEKEVKPGGRVRIIGKTDDILRVEPVEEK
ncbi:MAG: NfeD family protein, partial [Nitrososphaerota archaeon]